MNIMHIHGHAFMNNHDLLHYLQGRFPALRVTQDVRMMEAFAVQLSLVVGNHFKFQSLLPALEGHLHDNTEFWGGFKLAVMFFHEVA